jgi:hypothetical protein
MRKPNFYIFLAVALFVLSLPAIASAQYNRDNGRWGRNGRDDRNYGYNRSALKDAINRVERQSDRFKDALDSALDRSRANGSEREDRLNEVADRFQDAADDLKDNFDDGRNLNSSANDARRLLQLGSEIDRFIGRARLDGRTESSWNQIRRDLDTIANAYGFNYGDFDDGYNRGNNGNGRGNGGGGRRTWPF